VTEPPFKTRQLRQPRVLQCTEFALILNRRG
jgi:hypothetical protein